MRAALALSLLLTCNLLACGEDSKDSNPGDTADADTDADADGDTDTDADGDTDADTDADADADVSITGSLTLNDGTTLNFASGVIYKWTPEGSEFEKNAFALTTWGGLSCDGANFDDWVGAGPGTMLIAGDDGLREAWGFADASQTMALDWSGGPVKVLESWASYDSGLSITASDDTAEGDITIYRNGDEEVGSLTFELPYCGVRE